MGLAVPGMWVDDRPLSSFIEEQVSALAPSDMTALKSSVTYWNPYNNSAPGVHFGASSDSGFWILFPTYRTKHGHEFLIKNASLIMSHSVKP